MTFRSLLSALAGAVAMLCSSSAAAGYILSITAPASAMVGDAIDVDVNIASADDLFAADFTVNYDPSLLGFQSAAPGGVNSGWFFFDSFDLGGGTISISTFDLLDTPGPIAGSLARLRFDVIGAGVVVLSVTDIALATDLGGPIADTEITASPARMVLEPRGQAPAPGTLALLGIGLLLLSGLRAKARRSAGH